MYLRHALDSWIEVASQPSSSSLSSAADEIITTGLRLQPNPNARRRRRPGDDGLYLAPHTTSGTSSQEEYEESESESDKVMTSSNEGIQPSPPRDQWRPPGDHPLSSTSSDNAFEDGDEDENATAIGLPPSEAIFTPQPNIFTHPQFAQSQTQSENNYSTIQRPSRALNQRHSYPAQPQHTPYNALAPSYQVDHDEQLRASLSTLLSCAAAARGLPKASGSSPDTQRRTTLSNRVDTTTLRMVPESEVLGSETATAQPPPDTEADSLSMGIREPTDKGKRKAAAAPGSAVRSSSKERRASKKMRRTSSTGPSLMEDVSPTLLTWVVSAGVVVLVSAISFSAGYVVGKEAGKAEASTFAEFGSGIRDAGRCGRDYIMEHGSSGLKRLRWTGATSSIRA